MISESKSSPRLTLYRGWDSPGTYVWSPFVTKLEARFRFAGLSYHSEAGSLSKTPRGKIPYIAIAREGDDTDNNLLYSDSTLIIEKLVEDGVLDDLNAKLPPTEKAHDAGLRALLEDKLYFYQSYEKWHINYYTMRSHVLSALPYPVQVVVGLLIYRKSCQTLHGQGTARYTSSELSAFKKQIWENVNALLVASKKKRADSDLDDDPFWVMGGNGPSEADAVVFAFVSAALVCTAAPESQGMVKSFPALLEYAQRIHDRHFPDFASWK